MAVSDWSTTAASNTTVGGVNIGEGCDPANLNNSDRAIMADVAALFSDADNTTGDITHQVFKRGSGAGIKFTVVSKGDASNGVGGIGFRLNGIESAHFGASKTGFGKVPTTYTVEVKDLVGSAITASFETASTGAYIRFADSTSSSGASAPRFGAIGDGLAAFTSNAERLRITSSGHVQTGTDNAQTLGTASLRWSVVYAGTGTINTSDENEKDWRGALSSSELAAAKRIASEIGAYRFLSAIAEKGDNARYHVGVKAQQVASILQDEGLDPFTYGFVCRDTVGDGERWGIRPDELLFFLTAAQEQRLEALEA